MPAPVRIEGESTLAQDSPTVESTTHDKLQPAREALPAAAVQTSEQLAVPEACKAAQQGPGRSEQVPPM